MDIKIIGAEALSDGIALVASELGLRVAQTDSAVILKVIETERDGLKVTIFGKNAEISYGGGKARFFRALAILASWLRSGVSEKTVMENPLFTLDGAMVDMSRNAVMNVKTVKFMLRKMALMGLNMFMLYTEDTYEIEGRPYFGYMRGRYTKDEIRELDAYAIKLGIELIPCIQVLGHLATHLKWTAASGYKDTANVLLVGADATYELIDDMFKTVSECFTSKRLHMGMDETHDLGTGAYLDKNGYRPSTDIYLEHLGRVVEIAKKYGFLPMMWSDMFFELAGGRGCPTYHVDIKMTDDIAKRVPEGVQQVFWDYYHANEDFYSINIEKHKMLGENTMFAGGIWMWSSHCPRFSKSLECTPPALEACKKGGIKEVLATIWHNGSEGSLVLAIAGLAWYAGFDYSGSFDEDAIRETFEMACPGAKYDDFLATELPGHPHGGSQCATRALIYNDPLVGLIDAHIKYYDAHGYYVKTSERLKGVGQDLDVYKYAFDIAYKVSRLLEIKSDYGIRLKAAYDKGDKIALASLAEECDEMIKRLEDLRDTHRTAWMEHNKPFGWEVHDIRYGGLVARFKTAKARINDYLSGAISVIEELEAERIAFQGDEHSMDFIWRAYNVLSTVNNL